MDLVNNLINIILPARSDYLDDLVGVLLLRLFRRRGSIWNLLASVEDLSWVGCRYRLRVPPFLVQRQGCNECTNYVLTSSSIPAFLHACWREVGVTSRCRVRICHVSILYDFIIKWANIVVIHQPIWIHICWFTPSTSWDIWSWNNLSTSKNGSFGRNWK